MEKRATGDFFASVLTQVAADALIARGPVLLHGVSVTGDDGTAIATVHNGSNENGTVLVTVSGASTITVGIDYSEPVYCERGIYVNLSGAATNQAVSVQWSPIRQIGA